MTAVIVGATGLVGYCLLQKLLTDPEIERVISLSRKSVAENVTSQREKLHEILVSDLTEMANYQDQLLGDLYFCCLGTTIKKAGSQKNFRKIDYDAVLAIGKIAEVHKARSLVVVSAMGANAHSAVFYNRVKGETEEALKSLRLRRLVVFRPGLLLGERSEFRLGEKIFSELFSLVAPILPMSWVKSIGTEVNTLAERMVVEAKRPGPSVEVIEARQISF